MKFIEHDSSFSEEEKKQAKALKVACNLNDAACKLKLKLYKEAEKLCTKVSEIEIYIEATKPTAAFGVFLSNNLLMKL